MERGRDRVVGHHLRQPVRTQQDAIAGLNVQRVGFDRDAQISGPPTTLVMTWRRRCPATSSGRRTPLRTISAVTVWSWVIWSSWPSLYRYAHIRPRDTRSNAHADRRTASAMMSAL